MADFSIAAVISNHCVLQRNKNIAIFGQGRDRDKISAELFNQDKIIISKNECFCKKDNWILFLPPVDAQENCTLKISCNNLEKIFTDISIGEVWIAGGQSNMEFELQNCTEGPDELEKEKNPNVRFYYTNKIAWKDQSFFEAEKNTCWQTWDSEWKKSWSAVGYFFGKKLASELGVTVGIIGCNWGGTSASAWMNQEALTVDSELRTYVDEQIEATKGKSIQQQCDEYDKYTKENDEWQQKCNELYATVPGIEWDEIIQRLGPCQWPGPKSCKNPYRPSGLYECMLQRIMPYSINGVIWYQGESDDHKPQMYYKLFSRMIQVWRDDWNDNSLPFVFVQLPEHRYKQDKDFKHWCYIREAQLKVSETVKNAFMTCALDLGQYNDIHPKSKQKLGYRMALNALYNIYGKVSESDAIGPTLKSSIIQDGKITLVFNNASNGFDIKEDEIALNYYKSMEANQKTPVPENFTGFEIAGSDGIYYPAEFAIGGTDGKLNTITVMSREVPEPMFARYAWYNYGPVTVFGKNGIPLSPFRTNTNDSKITLEHAEVQQIMTV